MSAQKPSTQVNAAASKGLMRPVNRFLEQWIPSALTFAIVLTLIVAVLAFILTDASPTEVVTGWGEGLAGLLAFMTQMCLILLLGHMLANTGPVRKLLTRLASVPGSPAFAYVFVFVVAALASLITWGLGLVVGALLAREIAVQARSRGLKVHFPLLVAAGYSGFIVWHMGYSGSGPLTAATPDSFLAESLGGEIIPVSETIFSTWNLLAILAVIVVCAVLFFLVAPKKDAPVYELPESIASESRSTVDEEIVTPADRIDASRVLTLIVGLALVIYLAVHFAQGGGLTLDIVNWSFLALIFLLVKNPFELIHLTKEAASNVGEILLQFPLYAGILGMMSTTGLIAVFSDALVSIANPTTFGVLALISAGLVNFFVPSGGGQFAVQGPIMLDAANQLGVDPSVAIMAVSYGDQWTNMLQPFWALPVLAIAGLKMRDILGYTSVIFLGAGVVMAAALIFVSL
ncbi:MAG: short-chain fatty acid transporter [Brevibacterium aurantiacum]|uniref:Serine--pyruvate aminotransferase n=1 Tax=Brevibacterium aurantiacum TaxID=273384 RepID=A0A2H1HHM1_BREAU|nr:TIGR00366 family protein [Brevibacterium aurantiacum]MDN5585577.1 TIGR00366 family protein [Brevibacterium sp.]AZL10359.1 serine--pyruvate aminotransferase [Brevibacterium aurantiacum]AZL14044.1 serine--pyruvate aminotransferase [Brevibacterium aurantiacum]PCC54002.1 serine--pyruvate aminotransferase [Brevibacterium aurantiacum]PCC57552.1 serine--pyruvate aminotransferase [Brevibacterium aurantiacum]